MSPPALDRVVRTCLAKDPEERWQSASDLERELRGSRRADRRTARRSGRRPPPPVRRAGSPWAWSRSSPPRPRSRWRSSSFAPVPRGRTPAVHAFVLTSGEDHVLADRRRFGSARPLARRRAHRVRRLREALGAVARSTGTVAALGGDRGRAISLLVSRQPVDRVLFGREAQGIEASGGPVQIICDAPTTRGGSWGRAASSCSPRISGRASPAFRRPEARPRRSPRLDDRKRHTTHRWPWFLPDGKHFLYLAANHANPRSEESGIYVGSLDGGDPAG